MAMKLANRFDQHVPTDDQNAIEMGGRKRMRWKSTKKGEKTWAAVADLIKSNKSTDGGRRKSKQKYQKTRPQNGSQEKVFTQENQHLGRNEKTKFALEAQQVRKKNACVCLRCRCVISDV